MDEQRPDTQLVSLTDTSLECPICKNVFETDGKYQPKILKCGHTFCKDCIENMSNPMGVKCPYCFAVTPVGIMGIYGLPVNITLTTIINNLRNQNATEDKVANEDLCCACKSEKAVKVCFSCDPGGCKLCEACCTSEHERGFAPVRNHRPVLIKDLQLIPRNACHTHNGQPYTHYSETTETFACQNCLDNLSEDVRSLFKPFDVVVGSSRAHLEPIMKNLEKYLERVQESHHNIAIIQSQLRQTGPKTIQDIQRQFAKFQLTFKERQKSLLDRTEKYLSHRKEILGEQLSELRAITSSVINEKEKLKALMQQDDKDFLVKYRDTFQSARELLDAENPALQRPVFEAEMSVYVPEDFSRHLLTVGSVGGGPDIINFKARMINGLLRLNWDVQEMEHIQIGKYELEYQLLPVSLDSEGPTSIFCNGHAFYYYIYPLRPGYTYTFRMRCSIYSGWGMWTTPFTAKYDNFPLTISYTRLIVQIKVPATGRYRITAKGAKAADGRYHKGGRGAIVSAVFTLKEGDILDILCGGKSDCQGYHSGGAGGTFVSVNTRELPDILVVAGGGGGTRGADNEDVAGCDANLEPHGTMANATNCSEGGINGAPGNDAMFTGPAWGYGGAGWQQSSTTAKSFVDGGDGGECGGFGGGGGVGMYGGGGGGGFSGGGGGRGGGGGGSYVRADGDDVTREIGHMDHGEVRIMKLPISNSSANSSKEICVLSHASSSDSSKETSVLSPNNTSLSSTTEQLA